MSVRLDVRIRQFVTPRDPVLKLKLWDLLQLVENFCWYSLALLLAVFSVAIVPYL